MNNRNSRRRKKKKEKGTENIFEEFKAENFPNTFQNTDIKTQEAQRAPNKLNQTGPHQDIL